MPRTRASISSVTRFMSEEESSKPAEKKTVELVPLDKTNIEAAAAVTGGILGLVLTGPVGGQAMISSFHSPCRFSSLRNLMSYNMNFGTVYNLFTFPSLFP